MAQVTAAGSRDENGQEVYIHEFSESVATAFEVAPAWMTVEVEARTPWFSARVHLDAASESDAERLITKELRCAVDQAAKASREDFAFTWGVATPEAA